MIRHYDELYLNKDYAGEVETILSICQHPKKVLDVGCGTGNHAVEFANRGSTVVGTDIDLASIIQATNKIEKGNPRFICTDIADLDIKDFDLAVSLFNVINYINNFDDLIKFFIAIREKTHGMFIFDCWNGIAAILDNPKNKVTEDVSIKPVTYLFDQRVEVDTHVNLNGEKFTYSYQQTLWTPWELRNILEITGFKKIKISEWMKPDVPATENSWKIMVVCE